MKKEKNKNVKFGNWLMFLFYLIVGGICGFFGGKNMGNYMNESGNKDIMFIVLILFFLLLYLSLYIQIVVHEAGHLVFGKLSGYQFVSFRIGSFMLVSEEGKLRIKRFRLKGTGGQCLMMPPKPGEDYDYPYTIYNLGGVMANLILSSISLLMGTLIPFPYFVSMFFILMFIIGVFFAATNGIPMKIGGIANDGFNLKSVRKDTKARRAFWLILETNALLAEGKRLREMPSEWFEYDQNQDLDNSIVCSVGLLRCSYLQDLRLFDQAKELSEYLVENASGMLDLQKNELRCELMFYEIIDLCREEEIEKKYSKNLKKYIKITSSYISRRRLMYAYELLVKNNPQEAKKHLGAFEKISKTYPYKSEIESERELLDLINEKADNRRSI